MGALTRFNLSGFGRSLSIAAFGYADCIGHPCWFDRSEHLGSGKYPLHLVSNQPRTRLHSQYDFVVTSRNGKIEGREAARRNPQDASVRGICQQPCSAYLQ